MIMQASSEDGGESDVRKLFPPDEGRTKTLGINLPPSIAKAISRTGNRRNSISQQLLSLIDPVKLRQLLEADAQHQEQCERE